MMVMRRGAVSNSAGGVLSDESGGMIETERFCDFQWVQSLTLIRVKRG